MTWTIDVPFHPDDRDQPLSELLAENADEAIADPEQRRVVACLLSNAASDPEFETVADLLDHVEGLDPAGRRALLDRARESAGLETATEIEGRETFEMMQPTRRDRDAAGRAFMTCGARSCSAYPVDRLGNWQPAACRRWWCAQHQHLAEEGDDQPPEPKYVVAADLSLRPVGAELERLKAEDAKRREEAEARRAQQRAELDAIQGARERYEKEMVDSAPTVVGLRQSRSDTRLGGRCAGGAKTTKTRSSTYW